MSVDLPAPFSPQIAWISPRATSSVTSCSAFTPGKVLVIERISRMLVVTSASSSVLLLGSVIEGCWWREGCPPATSGCTEFQKCATSLEAELILRPVPGVHERGLHVVLHDLNRLEQVRGNDLLAVVVG